MEILPTKEDLIANRNEIGRCPCCGGNIADRIISLYRGLIEDMYKVYCWCGANKRHEFQMKDIRHLLTRNSYARFGDLVWFGGIVYKNGKAHYGMNMVRAKNFFHGFVAIPGQITINQITNQIEERRFIHINEIKPLKELMTQEGLYDHERIIY